MRTYKVKSGISDSLKIKIKLYENIEKLVAVSCGVKALNNEQIDFCGIDAEGNQAVVSVVDAINFIKEDGVYGFIEVQNEPYRIHMWYDKNKVKMSKMISFIGHEIGHVTDFISSKDKDLEEEFRAERFGEVSVFAYELAAELLSKKKR